jgi:ionotropic glutamate receptor NMDA 3A
VYARPYLACRLLQEGLQLALSGSPLLDGFPEKPLISHFELLNLVPNPVKSGLTYDSKLVVNGAVSRWRRVGLVSGRNVHLDTIVWPGGDIVVSGKIHRMKIKNNILTSTHFLGLSAKARSKFRIVTALAPPFVMETVIGDSGTCLRGLVCHRIIQTGQQNLSAIFNSIEIENRQSLDGDDGPEGGKLAYV